MTSVIRRCHSSEVTKFWTKYESSNYNLTTCIATITITRTIVWDYDQCFEQAS